MLLTPGARLGPYSVVEKVGEGGMGEVYRARDTRLDRDVALKILPELFAADPDRLARFEREARTLAALNHPNVAQIHGVEDLPAEGGTHGVALVMEFVEGETLADWIARGPVPLDDALPIARQIAEALEAAHERGIIHRDLKPANVKVSGDGRVKVLDFGLAKALEPADQLSGVEAMNSPTLTLRATQLGVILGTAAYMAPEQARGRPVDRRADVWAFGVLLYEMITGRRAFDGADISDVLAAVLKDVPAFDSLPPGTPPAIHRLLRRCLEKDRAKRLDSMAAIRLDIDEAIAPAAPLAPLPPAGHAVTGRRAAVVLGLLALIALGTWLAAGFMRDTPRAQLPLRLSVDPGFDGIIAGGLSPSVAISPDGRSLVFAGVPETGARPQLYLRRLDELTVTPLAGTEDASGPFFSPDGQWIAFFASGRLKKVSTSGGAALVIVDAEMGRGGAWGDDDHILFTPVAMPGGRLMRVPASGGATAEPVGPIVEGHVTQRWPQLLPGGQAVIYTGLDNVDDFSDACLVVHPLPGGTPRVVQCGGFGWRYAASGHMLYVHGGTLFAAPFDVKTLSMTGTGVPIANGILSMPLSGAAHFDVSRDGLLVYVPGADGGAGAPLERIDRAGLVTAMPVPPQNWQTLAYAPDGRALALDVATQGRSDIWVYDIGRQALTRLTFNAFPETQPVWTPDSKRVTYSAANAGPPNLFWKLADGSGPDDRLLNSPRVQFPSSWHPDGRHLLYTEQTTTGDFDVWVLPMQDGAGGLEPGTPRALHPTPANEAFAMFSPDGRWIAYTSDESGEFEVYVRSFDGASGKWQISVGGGLWPVWSARGPELLYGTIEGRVMVVTYEGKGATFAADRPAPWTSAPVALRGAARPFDLHPDGSHIVTSLSKNLSTGRHTQLVLVTDIEPLRRNGEARQP